MKHHYPVTREQYELALKHRVKFRDATLEETMPCFSHIRRVWQVSFSEDRVRPKVCLSPTDESIVLSIIGKRR